MKFFFRYRRYWLLNHDDLVLDPWQDFSNFSAKKVKGNICSNFCNAYTMFFKFKNKLTLISVSYPLEY